MIIQSLFVETPKDTAKNIFIDIAVTKVVLDVLEKLSKIAVATKKLIK